MVCLNDVCIFKRQNNFVQDVFQRLAILYWPWNYELYYWRIIRPSLSWNLLWSHPWKRGRDKSIGIHIKLKKTITFSYSNTVLWRKFELKLKVFTLHVIFPVKVQGIRINLLSSNTLLERQIILKIKPLLHGGRVLQQPGLPSY